MTREELKKHCEKQVEACEMWAKHNGEEPRGKIYEEHKLILELLEQTRWIPVSERLPEENITVLGTTAFDDLNKTELYNDCGEWKWYADGNFDVPIVAWMPLPEPYKAESEE